MSMDLGFNPLLINFRLTENSSNKLALCSLQNSAAWSVAVNDQAEIKQVLFSQLHFTLCTQMYYLVFRNYMKVVITSGVTISFFKISGNLGIKTPSVSCSKGRTL